MTIQFEVKDVMANALSNKLGFNDLDDKDEKIHKETEEEFLAQYFSDFVVSEYSGIVEKEEAQKASIIAKGKVEEELNK